MATSEPANRSVIGQRLQEVSWYGSRDFVLEGEGTGPSYPFCVDELRALADELAWRDG